MAYLRPFSIRLRLLCIITFAILPMLGLLIHGAERSRLHEVQLAATGLDQTADLVAAREAQVIESARQLLTAMSVAPAIRYANAESCSAYVHQVRAAYTRYEVISRYDPAGRVTCGTGPIAPDLGLAFRELIPRALAHERFVVGPYTMIGEARLAVLPLAYAVRDGTGRTVGVLASALRLEWWGAAFQEAHRVNKVTISLIGPAGALLASHPPRADALGVRVPWWTAVEPAQALFEFDGDLLARSSIGASGLTVVVSRSLGEIVRETDGLFWLQLQVGLAFLVAGAIAAWILGEWMVAARVRKLTAFVHRLEAGDLGARAAASSTPDGFGPLERALDRMAETLESKVIDLSSREAQFRHEALHDVLTGLPNRRAFDETIDLWIEEARGAASRDATALLLVDLDGFKQVNDTLGHDVGDAVLVAVGRRLLGCLRPTDIVARLGGDEFAIGARAARPDVEALAGRIVRELSKPLRVDKQQIQLGASLGVAFIQGDRDEGVEAALKQADLALYEAKRGGRARFRVAGRSAVSPSVQTETSAGDP